MIDVMLVDDHDLVRMGIRGLLEERTAVTGIQVVGEANSGEQALDELHKVSPDVVLMDLNMPGMGGLEATRRMVQAKPGIKVLVLTAMDEGPVPRWVLEAGASGYLTKGCRIEEMIAAIHGAVQGERHISPAVAQRLALSGRDTGDENPFDELSRRERQILLMILQGLSHQAISATLDISPKTVSTYKCRVLAKLRVNSDLQLVTLAARHGLLASQSEES
ncbi:MAG TPA: response regulator [Thioalkalivibrio sp.]|nr:response regulator [Thioalkalivibrio sp.]